MTGKTHTPNPANNQGNPEPEKKHPLEYAIFVFVVITAFATGAAAWYSRHQWLTAVDFEQKQTRAYVFLRDIRLEKTNGDFFDMIPEWENAGVSETKYMSSYVNRHVSDIVLPTNFNFGDFPSTIPIDTMILGPKSVANISFDQIDRKCLTQFNRRDEFQKFYIWGWARYLDIFDQPHATRFCWDISQVVFAADGRSARLSHTLCHTGNCADEQCPIPPNQTIELRRTACKPEPQ